VVDRDLVATKLAELADRIGRVKANRPPDPQALGRDRNALDLVAFNLMLAVQSCLDLASHLIADEGWEAATTFAAAFERLADHGVIAPDTARAMGEAAKFRNFVAHGYVLVDPARIFAAATDGLADLERFGREVRGWVGRPS
jgi:uncharacterized protein YutE (UPF0331/DUF86 family)